MVRVCHFTNAHPSTDVRVFEKECLSLSQRGYDVTLVAPGSSEERGGVHIIGVDKPSKRIERILKTLRLVYDAVSGIEAEIYHFHDPDMIPYGRKLARQGKRVIFDCHENIYGFIGDKAWIPKLVRPAVAAAFNSYITRALADFSAVISVDTMLVEMLGKHAKRVAFVSNYPKIKPLNSSDRAPRTIAFAGGVMDMWSHEAIVRAISEIDGARYVLCGKASEAYLEQLSSLPGWDKVDYRGMVPHDEAWSVLESASIGVVLAKKNENAFGKRGTQGNTKIYEEMGAGLPVVCSDFEVWHEMLDRYNCGICVDPENVGEIRNAFEYLMKNPEVAKEMGMRGRAAIEKEYCWETQETNLLRLYEEVLHG